MYAHTPYIHVNTPCCTLHEFYFDRSDHDILYLLFDFITLRSFVGCWSQWDAS